MCDQRFLGERLGGLRRCAFWAAVRDILFCVREIGRIHSGGPEELLAQIIVPRLASHLADDLAELRVAGIAICPPRTRCESQRQRVRGLYNFAEILNLEWIEAGFLADDARRVAKKMANRNGVPRRWYSFEVLADRIIEAEPALLAQQQNSHGDERFAD